MTALLNLHAALIGDPPRTAEAALRARRLVDAYRAELAEEFATRLEALDCAEAGDIVRAMGAPAAAHSCSNCDGIHPDSCLMNPQRSGQPDRCPDCLCADCGGRLDQHSETNCSCADCALATSPEYACRLARFEPPESVFIFAGQLGPLLSAHLNQRARLRCLAVAHASHHALTDYDRRES